ncbi:MAG: AMP-binding protein [Verrucomicrobia bacterium]|nr:AMP-binding protein [Verrucomicrobiota bacterium]MBS0637759.1 AMP-binding protein [Verrucomicrobiota bacterium]
MQPISNSPNTVSQTFLATVKAHGDKLAIRHTVPKNIAPEDAQNFSEKFDQVTYTWQEYCDQASAFAKALIANGVKTSNRAAVTIQGANSPKWLFANLGAILANGISAGVYATNNPEISKHCVTSSGAKVVVVEDEEQLKKYVGLESKAIACFVVWNKVKNAPKGLPAKVLSWDKFLKTGKKITNEKLERRMNKQKIGDVCSLIYTSGTTGMPKPAALTHNNLLSPASTTGAEFHFNETFRGISYLPFSHIAPQQLDFIAPLAYGSSIDIAPRDALQGSNLRQHIVEARPSYFLAVPRVWEKFKEVMDAKLATAPFHKRVLFQVASSVGKKAADIASIPPERRSYWDALVGRVTGAVAKVFEWIVFAPVKKALGLDACTVAASGAGALDPSVRSFFAGMNIKIIDFYGMSETSGLVTYGGKPLPATEIRIAEDGEIRVKGPQIFQQYWNNEAATREAFDEDGFLRTGDMGALDAEGRLSLTGRLKEILKTSGGENIPPVRIEGRLQAELSIISQAIVIGDKRNFITCLLTLKTDLGTNVLTKEVQDVLKGLGSKATTVEEAMQDELVKEYITAGIGRANKQADSQAQRVQKFTILQEDCTVANGLMTPTLKLRRAEIAKRYDSLISAMYA